MWAASVSRPPYGIAVPGLTFADTGLALPPDFLARAEAHFGHPFPPDYAAFLTRYNGGTPNRRVLDYGDMLACRDVRFFTSGDILGGEPVLLRGAGEIYDGDLADDADPALLRRVVLVAEADSGTDLRGRFYLGIRVDNPPDGHRVIDVWDLRDVGLNTFELCGIESFAELLALLREG